MCMKKETNKRGKQIIKTELRSQAASPALPFEGAQKRRAQLPAESRRPMTPLHLSPATFRGRALRASVRTGQRVWDVVNGEGAGIGLCGVWGGVDKDVSGISCHKLMRHADPFFPVFKKWFRHAVQTCRPFFFYTSWLRQPSR